MRKIALLAIAVVAILVVALLVIFWLNGNLFFRLSDAIVIVNGTASDKNEIYKSGNGDYLVFIKDENGKTKTYIVFSKSKEVGIPNRQIPSSYSRSVKTGWFVFSWHTESIIAGTEKLDRNAKIDLSPNEINFQIYDDNVAIKF
jgi:hypothetical protein